MKSQPFGPKWGRVLANCVVKPFWRVRVTGGENFPSSGPVILAANHTAVLDGPLLVATSSRPAQLLVKGAAFRGPIKWILRSAGQIPVTKDPTQSALTIAQEVLNRGSVVGIFPEGTRGAGTATRIHQGVGWLACHTQSVVVPVAISGTRASGKSVNRLPRLWSRVEVHFGEPVSPLGAEQVGRRDVVNMTEKVRVGLIQTIDQAARQ